MGLINRSQEDIDNEKGFGNFLTTQSRVRDWPEFAPIRDKLGIDVLRRTITKLLAEKVKKLLPELRQSKEEEMKTIRYC